MPSSAFCVTSGLLTWHLSCLTPLLVQAAAGYISGSTAMIADAAHSFSDIALSGVSLWSVRAAAMPKDKEHPYGQSFLNNLVKVLPSKKFLGNHDCAPVHSC